MSKGGGFLPILGAVAGGLFSIIPGVNVAWYVAMGVGMMVGGVLEGLLFPVHPPSMPDMSIDQKQAYGFSVGNPMTNEAPVALVYGKVRMYPNIFYKEIAGSVKNNSILELGLGIGEGVINDVYDIRINDLSWDDYVDNATRQEFTPSYDVYYGELDQPVDGRIKNPFVTTSDGSVITTLGGGTGEVIFQTAIECEEIRVGLLWPKGCYKIKEEDGVKSTGTKIKIYYAKCDSSGTLLEPYKLGAKFYWEWKHSGPIRREVVVAKNLEKSWYSVKVVDPLKDTDEFKYIKEIHLEYHKECTYREYTFPNTAYISMSLLATPQISGSIPRISCTVEGRKVRVYSDPTTYTVQYSNNPVWVLMDLIVSTTEADYDDFDIELAIETANYCDTEGYECNVVIDREMPLRDAIAMILTTFNGFYDDTTGVIKIVADKEWTGDPVMVFDNSNIIAGSLSIAKVGLKKKFNRLILYYINKDEDYKQDMVVVEDEDLIEQMGIIKEHRVRTELAMSQTQATKIALLNFNSQKLLDWTAQFYTDLEAVDCAPGDVIELKTELMGWGYTVDSDGTPVESGSGELMKITSIQVEPDGRCKIFCRRYDANIYDTSGIVVYTPPSSNLPAVWAIPNQLYNIQATTDYILGEDGTWKANVLIGWDIPDPDSDHAPYYYAIIEAKELLLSGTAESGTTLTLVDSSLADYDDPADFPAAVIYMKTGANAGLTRNIESYDSTTNTLTFEEDFPYAIAAGDEYEIWTDWAEIGKSHTDSYRWENVAFGTYKYRAIPFSDKDIGNFTDLKEYEIVVELGALTVPDVTNFTVNQVGDKLFFNWNPVQISNLEGYEIRYGNTWDSGQVLVTKLMANSFVWTGFSEETFTFWIKAIDTSGNYSTNATSVSITVSEIPGYVTVVDNDEKANGWNGTQTNVGMFNDITDYEWAPNSSITGDSTFALTTTGDSDFALNHPPWYDPGNAVYESPVIDIGSILTVKISVNDLIEYIRWDSSATYPDYLIEIKTSDDNVTWTSYQQFYGGEFTARYFQFRITISPTSDEATIYVKNIEEIFKAKEIIDEGEAAVTATTQTINFNKGFSSPPKVTATVVGGSGVVAKIIAGSITTTGFDVTVLDSAGTAVTDSSINWIAKGY